MHWQLQIFDVNEFFSRNNGICSLWWQCFFSKPCFSFFYFFCTWGEGRANLGMYLHQKDSPAASVLVSDHFSIILGTYLFAIFLLSPCAPLHKAQTQSLSHTDTQTHSNDDDDWHCHFHWILEGKAYIHTVCILCWLKPLQFVRAYSSPLMNGTSIYLGADARNKRELPDTSSVPKNPCPKRSMIKFFRISS